MVATDAHARGKRIAPPKGFIAWWRADKGIELSGGSVASWTDITRKHKLVVDVDGTSPSYTLTDTTFNEHASVGSISDTTQMMSTVNNIDLSNTSQVHAFVIGTTNGNLAAKAMIEHTSTTASGNGFLLYASNLEDWTAQCVGDVGQSRHALTTSDSTSGAAIVEGRFDKSLSSGEAQVYVNAEPGDSMALDSNNTNSFSSDILYVFARDGLSIPSQGKIAEIILYDSLLSAKDVEMTRLYLSRRYNIALV